MKDEERYFLQILRSALHENPADFPGVLTRKEWRGVIWLAMKHKVLPMIIDASYKEDLRNRAAIMKMSGPFVPKAKRLTYDQAQRTADFQLFYAYLTARGLRPVVVKGITARYLYPCPEQRSSIDEDLLICPEDIDAMHSAALEYGFWTSAGDEDLQKAQEITYRDKKRHLYIEVHRQLFSSDSDAYGDCNSLFEGVLDRTTEIQIYGQSIRTLSSTDHLLYLICHAYKHFLYGGVGIRQICDICMMAEKWADDINWEVVRNKCSKVSIIKFTAGLFRIGQEYLGFDMPEVFADIVVDPQLLLEDVLSGGLYGVNDIKRAHSANMTLDAVAADRAGKKRRAVAKSVFLPLRSMSKKYPYLRKLPFLLPVAWVQRVIVYISEQKSSGAAGPSRTIQIGRKRIDLLREYDIIR